MKGLWKNHFKHDYPPQLSERETYLVSSVSGRGHRLQHPAKETHKVFVKCFNLNLEYGSATKTYVEAPLLRPSSVLQKLMDLISWTSWAHGD